MKYIISKLDNLGRGITYVDDKITFVKNALPLEEVEIEITKTTSKYNEAIVTKYIKVSEKREEPICPNFEKCDSCHLMNMTYEDTIDFKKNKIKDILKKYADIDMDVNVIDSPNKLYYRNKITLKVVNGSVGYYKEKSHRLFIIDSCLLVNPKINEIIEDIMLFDLIDGEITIRVNYKDELLISINTNKKIRVNINELKTKYKIVGIIVNDKVIFGSSEFIDKINNKLFYISYNSFFQINNSVCNILFDKLNKIVKKSNNILDLYCGVGTLGINIANKVNKVYGIEIVENAILNAKKNSDLNKLNNTEYYCGKVEDILPSLPKDIDLVIVDPPRKGLDEKTIKELKKISSKDLIYISCDPITLSRDLKELKEDYNIKEITILDMFPYTYHCESVVILERK